MSTSAWSLTRYRLSVTDRPVGATGVVESTVMSRGCRAKPFSMASYLLGLWASAVTSWMPGSLSATCTTLNSCVSTCVEASTQMAPT